MPIPGFVTTDGGAPSTRFKAPVLTGTLIDATAGGPLPPAGAIMGIQSTASVINQIVSTSSAGLSRASFLYIPVTTGGLNGGVAPAYVGAGTPIAWNDATANLMVWSTSRASWMTQVVGTSFAAGNTTFTTS